MREWNYEKGYRIYYNLHKHVFSIQAWDVDKGGWRLFKHEESVFCKDVEFKVYQSGREKVLKEQKKNVHAFILCKRVYPASEYDISSITSKCVKQAYYNPYSCKSFEDANTGNELSKAKSVLLTNKQIYYVD